MTTASEFETGYEHDDEAGPEGREAHGSESDMSIEVEVPRRKVNIVLIP